jgi:hypothetical protein
MREEKTEVTAYSGYRGEESPKAFIRQGRIITVVEILKRWIQEEAGKRKRRRFFEVRGSEAPRPYLPAGRHRAGLPGNENTIIGSALTPVLESVSALPAPAYRQEGGSSSRLARDDMIHRIVYDEESLEWFYVRND